MVTNLNKGKVRNECIYFTGGNELRISWSVNAPANYANMLDERNELSHDKHMDERGDRLARLWN